MPAAQEGAARAAFMPPLSLLFALIFTAIFLLHAPLLRLPYFWDEAGFYVPASRDLLLKGDLIPTSTLQTAHPPLVMGWLALWWKFSGYTPAVTRTAMLLIAAFTLTGVFRLARQVAGVQVAAAATLCTALFPVFFAQSSLAHLDMAAAGFTVWGLSPYLRGQRGRAAAWFTLAALSKETAVVAPLALLAWELAQPLLPKSTRSGEPLFLFERRGWRGSLWMLAPVAALAAWFAYHRYRTGMFFGSPEYYRYNVAATLNVLRMPLAVLLRLWQLLGYMNMFVLTLAAALAMQYPLVPRTPGEQRPGIAMAAQMVFAVVALAYVVALAIVGGAVLARYLLPVYPLLVVVCVTTLRRRVRWWPVVIALVCLAFLAGLFTYPPYGFAPEDNLAYSDYVRLHQEAAAFIGAQHPGARVLTAWPGSDELRKPYLGYVKQPVFVVQLENFSATHVMAAARGEVGYELALLFPTKYDPPHGLLTGMEGWRRINERYFDYHHDLPAEAAARILGGEIVFFRKRGAQWVAVMKFERVENAQFHGRRWEQ